MVVPRPGNNKRMPNRPGNANNARRFMKPPGGAMMFANQQIHQQIPSSGYLDFTEPTNNTNGNNQKQSKNNSANAANTGNAVNKNRNAPQRRGNNGNQQRPQGGPNNGGNIRWGNNNSRRDMAMNNRNNMNNNMRQGGNMMHGQFGGPMPPRMHHPMGPMPPPMGMLPPLPPPPMQMHNMNGRFGPPRPLPPPMGGPIRRPPNFRMGPGPFPNRGMLPRSGNAVGGPLNRRNKVAGGMVNKNNRRNNGNNVPANQKNRKKNQMKNGKRTNQNVNKYALDKPWVTDEIREAHQIKTDLENQLKGKKNDEIFAKFKEQRDKFVSLYDAAKQAFVTTQKQDKTKVLKESDTGEQNDTNNDVEMPNASAAT